MYLCHDDSDVIWTAAALLPSFGILEIGFPRPVALNLRQSAESFCEVLWILDFKLVVVSDSALCLVFKLNVLFYLLFYIFSEDIIP